MNYKQIVASNIEAYTQQITEAIAEGWEVQYGVKAPMQVGFSFAAWLEKPESNDSVESENVVRKAGRPPKSKE